MLEPAPVRTYEEIRRAIDARLGSGVGVTAGEAAKQLSPSEHAVWALDNLLACLFDFRLHIWDQGFGRYSTDYDGARTVAAIAQVSRGVDPLIADLLAWTAHWVRTRPVPLISVVPELWDFQAPRARAFLLQVAARWPEHLDPGSIQDPPPYQRPLRTEPKVGFTPRGAGCPVQCLPVDQTREGLFRACLWAMWLCGESDERLDAFFRDYFAQGADEVEVLCRYVSFDGDGGDDDRKRALRLLVRPTHPLTAWLGEEPPAGGAVLLVDSLDEVQSRLGGWTFRRIEGQDGAQGIRVALRMDPDVLLIDGALINHESMKFVVAASETGHLVFVSGRSAAVEALQQVPDHVRLVDRRKN